MIHLVCNAHLDPVWLWRFDEGIAEALSTFRAAADFLDEYPRLIFNHNESLLYEWIEEYDPKLFERIRRHVATGRWEIIGGWFLQPDCNLPAGEPIVRHVLRGRQYFLSKFGKVPRCAVNFDSFGHARGLVQLLRQCGYEQYMVCRPYQPHYDFESPDFIWKGYDGSEIIVHRSDENYNSIKGKAGEEITEWLERHKAKAHTLFLWGVGNHGGGPSRKDLDDIESLIAQGFPVTHATPEAYFRQLDTSALPVVDQALNPVAEGCYTSQIRIKQQHRRLENDLAMVEKMASHASICGLAPYEQALIDAAWRDLLFAEFHDALPGSAIQPVEEDTLRTLCHGLDITAQLRAKYFFALSAGQDMLTEGMVPLLVYNPHPFMVKASVDCPLVLPQQNWSNEYSLPVVYQGGKKLRCQATKEEGNFNMDWCKRVVFEAELPACSMSRFDVGFDILPARPVPTTQAVHGKIVITAAQGTVTINTLTGLLDSYRIGDTEYIKPGALALEIFEDSFNSWGGGWQRGFPASIGRFSPMSPSQAAAFAGIKPGPAEPVRVIEEGALRTVVEALMSYQDSRLCLRYIVDMFDGSLELECFVFFAEKEKRLKLSVPSAFQDASYIGQTIFGRERLDIREGEYVSQYFSCIAGKTHALAILNDSTYGSDYANGEARLTLLRSAGYGAAASVCGEPFHDMLYQPRMEQGERRFRFRLTGGKREDILSAIDRQAAVFNQRPYALTYCPSGEGQKPQTLVSLDKENVSLSCFKHSEQEKGVYILRVYEAQGMESDFRIDIPCMQLHRLDTLRPFEIKTYRVTADAITETAMMEGIEEGIG